MSTKSKNKKSNTLNVLKKCIREYKKASILSPVFVALEVVLECILPFLMSWLVDAINGEKGMNYILMLGFILLGLAMLSLLFGILAGRYCAIASCGVAKNIRKDMFHKVQTYSFANIDKFSTSSLVTRMTTDVTNVQFAYMMIIRIAIRSPLMIIFSLTMSFTINVKLALIFLAAVPVVGGLLYIIIRKVYPIFDNVFKKYDNVNNDIQENVKAMRVVKAYVREDYESEKFTASAKELQKDFTRAEKILALNNPLMNFAAYMVTLIIGIFGAYLIIKTSKYGGVGADGNKIYIFGELSTGGLMSLVTYAMQILANLMMFSMILVMITMSRASAKRIVEVLNEESNIISPENPVLEVANGSIDFNGVSFKYSKTAENFALQDIDLHIQSGETLGIIGGTGSSKTTLIQLISRLYDATEGVVKVGGVDVKDYDLEILRNQVAVVLQKNVLFSGTIKENLRWGDPEATDEQLIEACRLAQADEFISSFPDGYDTYIEQGGANVSGGQKQRLCIARALLKKPKVLILDDSTSAVDTKTDALIRSAFKNKIPDTTKIIIAQRIASVQDADKIVVLDGGKISAVGKHEELLKTNNIYREVYMSQNKVQEGGESNE